MTTEEGRTGDWVAVADAEAVTAGPRAVTVDGVPLVLVRLRPDGAVVAYRDRCPRRLVPLSAGAVGDGTMRRAYHGWEFAPDGSVRRPAVAGAGQRHPAARTSPGRYAGTRGGRQAVAAARRARRTRGS